MYQPEAYGIALLFMIGSMLCWGSWANTMKLTRGYPFQLFYWDYVLGVLLGSLLWGLTLGSAGAPDSSFIANIRQADNSHIAFALAGGAVFNVANLLLVAAIDIAGLAVAFPVGIGLALVVGVLLNYFLDPKGNVLLLFGGVALVLLAIVTDAIAYRRREERAQTVSARGIQISTGAASLGPYTVAFFFAIGILICAVPVNYLLMRRPLTGTPPVGMAGYFQARPAWHIWGLVGGAIWCTGSVFNFVASHAQIVGPAVSYAIGQCATMVSAIWGVFVWREFANAPAASRKLIPAMFLLFLLGLASIAIAPMVVR